MCSTLQQAVAQPRATWRRLSTVDRTGRWRMMITRWHRSHQLPVRLCVDCLAGPIDILPTHHALIDHPPRRLVTPINRPSAVTTITHLAFVSLRLHSTPITIRRCWPIIHPSPEPDRIRSRLPLNIVRTGLQVVSPLGLRCYSSRYWFTIFSFPSLQSVIVHLF